MSEEEWTALQAGLRGEYEAIIKNLASVPEPSQETVTGYVSLVGHAGFHLGAIRQIAFPRE